jgi:pilus assembly protein CpaF
MSEGVFSDFFKSKAVRTKNLPTSILEKDDSSQTAPLQDQFESRFTGMTPEKMMEIQEYVERFVRDDTQNKTEIFKDPNEFNNRNEIQNSIKRGLSDYMRVHGIQTIISTAELKIKQNIWDELVGYGPLEPLLKNEQVTEIMVINAEKIYIEEAGDLKLASIRFKDYAHIKRILDRIIAPIGRKVDEQTPIVDARLPQGFRLNAVISPISLNGDLYITIRKFPTKKWTPEDLIRFGSASKKIFDFLELCVKARKNICVSGGTGSGKTTLLNVLSNCIPKNERIITIEDTAELKLIGDHILSEEARPANSEGTGAITIRDLVKTALRQRPDRIVVGECRGAEALDMLQAMNTGHDGSMTTGHANSPRDFLSRLEYMCMSGGGDMPLSAIRPQIASAVDIIVQIGRVRINGKKARKTLGIVEVLNGFTEDGDYRLLPLFESKFKGADKHEICPTGKLPTFIDELVEDFDFDIHDLDEPKVKPEPKV